jgi:hypothetical protein
MPTHGNAAPDNHVHTNRTRQPFNFVESFGGQFFLFRQHLLGGAQELLLAFEELRMVGGSVVAESDGAGGVRDDLVFDEGLGLILKNILEHVLNILILEIKDRFGLAIHPYRGETRNFGRMGR